MNDVDKSLDDELTDLYQQHKQETQVPRYIKRQVMVAAQKANHQTKGQWRSAHWVSAIASVAVFAILINMFIISKNTVDTFNELTVDTQNRELVVGVVHRLESEVDARVAKNEREQQFDSIYQDYQRQKLAFSVHHQQVAKLVAVSEGWSLKTCDDQLVKISPQLVSLFVDWEQIEANITLGDQVDITFDNQGRITKISRVSELMQC